MIKLLYFPFNDIYINPEKVEVVYSHDNTTYVVISGLSYEVARDEELNTVAEILTNEETDEVLRPL